MVLIVCAAALGSRAEMGGPIEGPVPQRSLLLWLALDHPSPAAALCGYPLYGYMWWYTRVSTIVIHT